MRHQITARRARLAASALVAAIMLAGMQSLSAWTVGRSGAGTFPPRVPITVFPQVRLATAWPAGAPRVGYTPAQIRAAYFVNPLLREGITGKGQSIVIVDSFGSPTIRHDLSVFDKAFKLRPPRSLLIIHPAGLIPRYRPTNGRFNWAQETTLDVEWAHVMAPAARIVLVETPVAENEGTSGFPQIVKAEKYVIAHHLGGVISQSFGATEETFPKGTLRPLRAAYLDAAQRGHDVTVVSASGDAGATDYTSNMRSYYPFRVTSWPASDPLVTSVGGLDLRLDRHGRRTAPDRVWNDKYQGDPSAGGGGLSIVFSRPAFQAGVAGMVGARRGVPDISMSASCGHPVAVYFSLAGGWESVCGTSEATPLFAGIVALADQVAGRPLGPINGYLYKIEAAKDPGIVDVTSGNNTVTILRHGVPVTVTGWPAGPGYDLASGLGTINARWFVRELARLAIRAGH